MPAIPNTSPALSFSPSSEGKHYALRPDPDVHKLVSREVRRLKLRKRGGGWRLGAVKRVIQDCVRGHLGKKP